MNIADRHDLTAEERDALRLKMAREGWANCGGDWQLWQVEETGLRGLWARVPPGSLATKFCSMKCRRKGPGGVTMLKGKRELFRRLDRKLDKLVS